MITLSKAHLSWCKQAALDLTAGLSVAPLTGVSPGVVPGVANWSFAAAIDPREAVTGSILPGANSFVLNLPSPSHLAIWFRKHPGSSSQFVDYLEGVVLHELVHFLQTEAIATPSAAGWLAYYSNPFEQEAHAAQIALSVRNMLTSAGNPPLAIMPLGPNDVLSTLVGKRIADRLAPFRTTNAGVVATIEFALAKEVNAWVPVLA